MKPAGHHALLACDVFKEEINHFVTASPPWCAAVFLEMGLHDRPDQLRQTVQQRIASLEADHPQLQTILLAYGRCGNGLLGVRAERCRVILPQAHDCISILLGGRAQHDAVLKKNPGTYFYSPGWIRGKRVPGPDREQHLRELYSERYGDDEEMLDELVDADREAFAHHNRAVYLSIFNKPAAENYCRDCASHQGWEFQCLKADPSFLLQLINRDWNSDRFLIVPPDHSIEADSDGTLVARP